MERNRKGEVVSLTVDDVKQMVDDHLTERGVLKKLETAEKVLNTAFKLIETDPHAWSSRPCQTCRAVGDIIGRPFGCYNPEVRG